MPNVANVNDLFMLSWDPVCPGLNVCNPEHWLLLDLKQRIFTLQGHQKLNIVCFLKQARESEEMEKERSINKLYREKIYLKMGKNRPLWNNELKEAEETQLQAMQEKTGSVAWEKVINGILHYFESIKISSRQAVRQFMIGFRNDEKLLLNALYSMYLQEGKSVDWFFESALKVLTLYDDNNSQFKTIVRQNLGTDVIEFMEKQEKSYEVMDLFEAQVPGIKQSFIKEMIINSFESK